MIETYKIVRGVPVIKKTPRSRLPYGLDLVDWLDGATLVSVTAVAVGVNIDGTPFIVGTKVAVYLTGLDEREAANNSCTFTFTSTEGTDSRTIYFSRR
jgi:hypothetical protein